MIKVEPFSSIYTFLSKLWYFVDTDGKQVGKRVTIRHNIHHHLSVILTLIVSNSRTSYDHNDHSKNER